MRVGALLKLFVEEVMHMSFLEVSALLMLLLAVADFAIKHGKK